MINLQICSSHVQVFFEIWIGMLTFTLQKGLNFVLVVDPSLSMPF